LVKETAVKVKELIRIESGLGLEKDELNKRIMQIEGKEQLSYNHPKVLELMELESGLEVEKLILQASKLPADFTPEDMMITSWLIEYVDEGA